MTQQDIKRKTRGNIQETGKATAPKKSGKASKEKQPPAPPVQAEEVPPTEETEKEEV